MFKYILLFLLSVVFVFNLNAQNTHKIHFELIDAIQRNSEKEWKVGISFGKNVDLDSLKHFFKTNHIPVKKRPVYLIKALQEVANASQKETISYLQRNMSSEKIHSFWIVNRIIVELKANDIYHIAEFDEVAEIVLERARIMPIEPVPTEPHTGYRSPAGTEPGLIAINAPAMWALGYTGRGTLLYNYDTGVWEDHPAFSSRYMGKRFPDEQSWHGYFRDYINGFNGNHGTHVLGTMAGLVESTQDTIGVAFDAYWIANDLVISPDTPVEAHAAAFQWALNPDGNINTVDDIPDVINNSWGRSDDETTDHCNSWISDMLAVIETAGIANVFSGGNDGPDNNGVGLLQSINISPVNTFSVGSVDANQTAPYPLSDFSSLGPTQCPGEGSHKIHPQVVAPGQNVRSAWGIDSYNSISGTSMAAPHVSGAVLLLKEAFPFLSGEDLLWALYESAIDYGPEGEDNTYGKGLIDVKAAFDLLSLEFEPVDPNNISFDMALRLPDDYKKSVLVCDEFISGKVLIDNLGQNTPDSIELAYWFSGSPDTVFHKIDGSDSVYNTGDLPLDQFGAMELNFELRYEGVKELEYDLYNNRCKIEFIRSSEKNVPFFEDFENGINDSIWIVDNPDMNIGWDTFPVSGIEGSKFAATLQFYEYVPRAGQKDGLLLSNLKLDAQTPVFLTYDYAYQPFFGSSTIRDTFRIFILNECDRANPILLKEAAVDELYVSDSIFINFKPQSPGHWKKDSIDLSDYKEQHISILFEGTNMKWNNLYIDNISVDNLTTQTTGMHDVEEPIIVYPNPASHFVTLLVKGNVDLHESYIRILDISGKTLVNQSVLAQRTEIDISAFEPGMYFLVFSNNREMTVKKMVKTR